jgi:hypothetical protein
MEEDIFSISVYVCNVGKQANNNKYSHLKDIN